MLLCLELLFLSLSQVNYIVLLEDNKTLRQWVKLPYLKYTQDAKKNFFFTWRDRMRGVDYKTQEKLVDDLYEETFEADGDDKV